MDNLADYRQMPQCVDLSAFLYFGCLWSHLLYLSHSVHSEKKYYTVHFLVTRIHLFYLNVHLFLGNLNVLYL